MVVISAAVFSKTRKSYFSRQFVEVKKSRLENLFAAFSNMRISGMQHSFVEMDGVRFLYQSMDEVAVLVLTNKKSNILQDVRTLNLLTSVITTTCNSQSEEVIMSNAFNIMMGFDELFYMGYNEYCNVEDVRLVLKAESSDEKLHDEISKVKEKEAKQVLRRKARIISQKKSESLNMATGISTESIKKGIMPSVNKMIGSPLVSFSNSRYTRIQGGIPDHERLEIKYVNPTAYNQTGLPDGLKPDTLLQTQDPKYSIESKLQHKPHIVYERDPEVISKSIHIAITETINAIITRDEGIKLLTSKGDMSLKVIDSDQASLSIQLALTNNENHTYKTHPYIDKKKFLANSVLSLREPKKSFPLNQTLEIFKWKYNVQANSEIPVSVSCWLSPGDTSSSVTVEYEINADRMDLKMIELLIPVPAMFKPEVKNQTGECTFDPVRGVLIWTTESDVPLRDPGLLEFDVNTDDGDVFFPIDVRFMGYGAYCNVKIQDVIDVTKGTSTEFSSDNLISSEKYQVV